MSWRHQLPCFASLGFRAVAPDMRGYGRSSVYQRHEDYALEHAVADMIELMHGLGREKAVWVGHDWGSPVVWSIASHHPDKCFGVANLCVPYFAKGFCPQNFLPLIDRATYPEAEFPAGQWEYQLFYEENFDKAQRTLEADVGNTVRALFRKGRADGKKKPSRSAQVRKDGGWFGGAGHAPDLPLDSDVLTARGPAQVCCLPPGQRVLRAQLLVHEPQAQLAVRHQGRRRGQAAHARALSPRDFDYTCETIVSRLAEPMRADCEALTEVVVQSGHWMAQEKPVAVNAAIAKWLATQLPTIWPH